MAGLPESGDATVVEVSTGQADLCRAVLDDLPEWFGIPDAKASYVAVSAELPMLACRVEGDLAGMLSLRPHTAFAAEVYVLGVMRRFHRQGIGRRLVEAAVRSAQVRRHRYLTVKTLAATRPDPHYAATRRFYEALGFLPIEEFPRLWGPANPCLYMIRPLLAGS